MKTLYTISLSFTLYLLNSLILSAQVGIGTDHPQGIFHIDALKNNDENLENKNSDDFIILPNGNVGIGNINPSVKLDIRGNNQESSLGIGSPTDTQLSATEAGSGAIKYYYNTNTDKGLKFSDGSNWLKRLSVDVKALTFANKKTLQNIPSNSLTSITNWDVSTDRSQSFSQDKFTAPRDGVYIATLNIAFANNTIANDSYIEVVLTSNSTLGIPQFRCVYSFPGTGSNQVSNIVSGSCTGLFTLKANNTITPQVLQTIGGTNSRAISTESSFNSLSISEL